MENFEEKRDQQAFHLQGGRVWVAAVLAILVAATGYSLFRLSREDQQRAELVRTNQALQTSVDQTKRQLQEATDTFNAAIARAQSAQLQAPIVPSAAGPEPVSVNTALPKSVQKAKRASGSHAAAGSRGAKDPRWSAMDAKLAEQQKQIEGTKSDIAKAREDMEGRLGSTRDELNGSIARTHDEVVELRKRGERNYYEFDLNKSDAYARTGPVSLSLRKANVKRKYYDLALIVDDQKIEKKHANLFEPLWISVPDRPEPVQVIVNSITKNNVKGYISEPKYRKSELSGGASGRSTMPSSNVPNPGAAQPGLSASDQGFSKLPKQ
jgi:hypothetical protein